jgi:4-hydroxy-tetrahydrodipicolinate synthase
MLGMPSSPVNLRGLWVPLVTPFDTEGRVDTAAVARLARRILGDGARGIVALGTTGEPAVLTLDEQRIVIETCAEVCSSGGGALMVGAGTNSTQTTVAALHELDGLAGVVAALVVVPYYTRPSPAGIVEHYRVAAAESPVPVVAYNIPYRTGRGLGSSELLEIANMANMAGMKQSVAALDIDTLDVLRGAPPQFHVLSGDDAFIVPTILMGGHGAIAAAAHVCTPMFVEMIDAALRGDVDLARGIAEALLPVVLAGMAEPNPAGWKAALHRLGEIDTPDLRAPMTNASSEAALALLAAIEGAKERRTSFTPSR